jgi:hypothetical protein
MAGWVVWALGLVLLPYTIASLSCSGIALALFATGGILVRRDREA